ncbi:MAG: undecaprenyl-phosphate glucose phosphotransferase, partial [Afipia sp.]|nr:undecaprenyl-phosphate glucose phosphotransferase [Afipia sp.]
MAGRAYPFERRRRLSPAALAVTNEKVHSAYSSVVINGVVRAADFVCLSIVGIASYLGYVVPIDGFSWTPVWAVLAMSLVAVISFQAAEVYDIEIYR